MDQRAAALDGVKISIKPGEARVGSSVPTTICISGDACPEVKYGGRVRFWFVGLELLMHSRNSQRPSEYNQATGAAGAAASTGLFFMRRLNHGYYEFRNVVAIGGMQSSSPVGDENEADWNLSVRGSGDNGIYYSVMNDEVSKNPFTVIFGGKASGDVNYRGRAMRTHVATGALQLSAGVLLNLDEANLKISGDLDVLREASLMIRDIERGQVDDQIHTVVADPFKVWNFQSTYSSGPFSAIFNLGRTDFGGETRERVWRGSLELMGHVTVLLDDAQRSTWKRGLFMNMSMGFNRYDAKLEDRDLVGRDFDVRVGAGIKQWK